MCIWIELCPRAVIILWRVRIHSPVLAGGRSLMTLTSECHGALKFQRKLNAVVVLANCRVCGKSTATPGATRLYQTVSLTSIAFLFMLVHRHTGCTEHLRLTMVYIDSTDSGPGKKTREYHSLSWCHILLSSLSSLKLTCRYGLGSL